MKKYKWYVIAFVIYIVISAGVDTMVTSGFLNIITDVIIAGILWSWAGIQSKPREEIRDSA